MKRNKPLEPGEPPKRKTSLRRSTPPQQSSELVLPGARKNSPMRTSSLTRKAPMKMSPPKPKLTPQEKAPLLERSGGWCELRIPGVCVVVGHDVAHRIGEGMGGRKGAAAEENDRLSNVLYACRYCHRYCHEYPATARGHGWMLRRGDNPPAEPVFYCGRWVLLDDEGGTTPHRGEEVA